MNWHAVRNVERLLSNDLRAAITAALGSAAAAAWRLTASGLYSELRQVERIDLADSMVDAVLVARRREGAT